MDSPAHPRTLTLPARGPQHTWSVFDEVYAHLHTAATGDDALVCTALGFLEEGDAPDVGVEPLADPKP